MKLYQTLFIMIVLNILTAITGLVTSNGNLDTAIVEVTELITDKSDSLTTTLTEFTMNQNWLPQPLKGAITSLVQTFNFVFMGFKIIGLVIANIVLFPVHLSFNETILILKIIGSIGFLYLMWFNVRGILHLYSFLRGSSE